MDQEHSQLFRECALADYCLRDQNFQRTPQGKDLAYLVWSVFLGLTGKRPAGHHYTKLVEETNVLPASVNTTDLCRGLVHQIRASTSRAVEHQRFRPPSFTDKQVSDFSKGVVSWLSYSGSSLEKGKGKPMSSGSFKKVISKGKHFLSGFSKPSLSRSSTSSDLRTHYSPESSTSQGEDTHGLLEHTTSGAGSSPDLGADRDTEESKSPPGSSPDKPSKGFSEELTDVKEASLKLDPRRASLTADSRRGSPVSLS